MNAPDPEFTALIRRLERASSVLFERGCLLQAIARKYYVVYHVAAAAARRHGVRIRGRLVDGDAGNPTHQALADVIFRAVRRSE